MVITARHLAKRAPSLKYSSRRFGRPSRPSVTFSPGCSGRFFAPASTLMPGMIPFFAGTARTARRRWSSGGWSRRKDHPEMYCSTPGAVKEGRGRSGGSPRCIRRRPT